HNPNPCPVAAHLALDPRSGRHRRRPRARSKVRPPSPPASRSTPSSSRRPGAVVLANLHPCYLRGSIVVLPLLPDQLLSGLHCRPPAAAGHADARDPSPGSLRCYRTYCRGSISFELCPSRIQPSPCLEILGKFDINGASWTKRGCLNLDESTTKLGDVIWRSV
uniref:Uncharacterized protein n=1 Tax=Aegilops tauschii subsp. strangulata TaxID=200361 RepID=A0A453CZ66_AEGTS